MNQATKQRIVGTVVLLALALIFLPIIFDGEGSYETPLSSRIPEPPVITLLPDPEPVRPVLAIADLLPTVAPESTAEPVLITPAPPATDAAIGATTDATAATTETIAAAVTTPEPVVSGEPPTLDQNGLPQGWSVRLGSFADASNASSLMQRLLASGYRAYTRPMPGSGGQMTGVFVGPWLERELVTGYQKQLQDEFQLSGLVVRYEVDPLQE